MIFEQNIFFFKIGFFVEKSMLKNDFFQKVKKMSLYYFFEINKTTFYDFSEKTLLSLQISHFKKKWSNSQKKWAKP